MPTNYPKSVLLCKNSLYFIVMKRQKPVESENFVSQKGKIRMIKRTYEELEPYFPPGHFGVTCKRYHGKDETKAEKFWIGVSEFEPDGGADWAYEDNPLEKVYYVLEGEMTVTDKDGNKYVIHANESISFPPNEGRGLKNESGKPAKMLVIINYPES